MKKQVKRQNQYKNKLNKKIKIFQIQNKMIKKINKIKIMNELILNL